jgi:CHAD domain-containing protein
MTEHEPGTRTGEDPEELHHMRVATRRMRAALRVFDEHLDADVMRPLLKGLRRTGCTLGAVRDLDVFLEKTQRYLNALPDERKGELDPLLTVLHQRRGEARERLIAYLDGRRYARFTERFSEFLETPGAGVLPAVSVAGDPRPQLVSRALPVVLYERAAAVWAFDEYLAEPAPLVRYHRLRIAGKGLRYTLEFFEEVLGPPAHPLIDAVKGLQDHLGDLQDAVVSSNALRDFLTWGTWGHESHATVPTEVVVAPGVATYLAYRQAELQELVRTFPKPWEAVRGADFSRRLAALVGALSPAGPS